MNTGGSTFRVDGYHAGFKGEPCSAPDVSVYAQEYREGYAQGQEDAKCAAEYRRTHPDTPVSAGTADAMHATITGLMRENERMREALRCAAELIPTARGYFPKSIQNGDRLRLESTCAAIGKALN